MEIEFERVALYEEVWTVPLTQLGKKYGLSDNGIRKVCKALNIPLPAIGHWAKVAAGHTVVKISLPAQAKRTTFTSRFGLGEKDFSDPADERWLVDRLAFERAPGNHIAVAALNRYPSSSKRSLSQ
jgi:hypothetical protein